MAGAKQKRGICQQVRGSFCPQAAALLFGVMMLLLGAQLFGQIADVVYLDGFPMARSGGRQRDLDFGDQVRPGDSVITGRRDLVELEQLGNTIIVNESTVFAIREVEGDDGKETVLSNTVGSVSYRFTALAGRRQVVQSASAVAGVRGTEFTVFAGADGSTMFLVDQGLIEVESAGHMVEVSGDQGVEVAPGQPPGAVFERLGRPIDFSTWNSSRLEEMLQDPAASARRVQSQLANYQEEMLYLFDLLEERRIVLEEAREGLRLLREEIEASKAEGEELSEAEQEQLRQYRREHIDPVVAQTAPLFLNYRFYALSALSLRRHVLGTMYMELKSRHILDSANPGFQEFLALYQEILDNFEANTAPKLVPADI